MTHKPVILAFGLYANETSLSMRKNYKLQMFESKVLRKIFGPKKDDANEQFRIYNENFVTYTSHLLLLGY
jgi:hypothetical protein